MRRRAPRGGRSPRATFARPYRQLVMFYFAFSVANGLTTAAQGVFPYRVLRMTYPQMQGILAMMRVGQTGLAPTMGRWCDRWGSRPVMIVSQLIVALGPLCFYFATPAAWWWIVVAHVAWMAYAGLNVGLDSVKLKLAPDDNNVAVPRGVLRDGRFGVRCVDGDDRLAIGSLAGERDRPSPRACRVVYRGLDWADGGSRIACAARGAGRVAIA